MKSELTITEIRNKLTEYTKIGNPKLKFSTIFILFFYDSSKPFFGFYDNSTFNITSNLKVAQSFYIIRGKYKVVNKTVEIQYEVLPKFKYQHIWWIFCFLFGISLLMFINIKAYNKLEINHLIVINLFVIVMYCFGFLNLKLGKRNLEKKFIKLFS